MVENKPAVETPPVIQPISSTASKYNPYDQFKAIHRSKVNTEGNIDYLFTEEFIKLFDASVLTDNRHVLSIEQQVFITKFYDEAERVTMGTGTFSTEAFKQLDKFFGEYKEEVIDE